MARAKAAVKVQSTTKEIINELFSKLINRVDPNELIDYICDFLRFPTNGRSEYLKNEVVKYESEIKEYTNNVGYIALKRFSNSKNEATEDQINAYKGIMNSFIKNMPEKFHVFKNSLLNGLSNCCPVELMDVLDDDKKELSDNQICDFIKWIKNSDKDYLGIINKQSNFIFKLCKMTDAQKEIINVIISSNQSIGEYNLLQSKYNSIQKENELNLEKIQKLAEEKKNLSDKNKTLRNEVSELKNRKELDQEYIEKVETLKLRNEKLSEEKEALYKEIEELKQNAIATAPNVVKEKKTKSKSINEIDFISSVKNALASKGLCYDADDIYNFHISLKSSPLTILAGKSGLGKTRLPLAYAECINAKDEDGTLLFLPISPSYTEPSDVLGFYNVAAKEYQPASTGFVDFLLHASEHKNKMHMVIFDEMNLSQIEYWFAPFMSLLEKPLEDRMLILYSNENQSTDVKPKYPPKIHIGENIIFVGTINLDETTKDMSDRLIDRAIVINLKKLNFIDFYNQEIPNNEDTLICESFEEFESMKKEIKGNYIKILEQREVEFLDELHKMLQGANSSKGVSFRNVYKISNYLMESPNNSNYSRSLAFDLIFKQTILKKLNGYDASISKILGKLDEDGEIVEGLLIEILDKYNDISDFVNTKSEIKNKIKEFDNYGFTR